MDKLSKLWNLLKTVLTWFFAVIILLVALLSLVSTTSCSTMSRVIVKETSSGVSITTTQSADQQNSTSIQVNPTIHLKK